ncbi:hypothetical protein QFZ42_000852 [Variovorax paradoxus]|uniref:hypothetical protein n=1 Tax=Variovorax paradoxus TaxID=34073 RepID=UPI00278F024F|nr:hypothetical protein [Variovorax paradoxus]MDQ0569018.1 hypothetical protein [Variovorax paradoxus]
MLEDLMRECIAEAKKRKMPFAKFSLQDCRPKGTTDKQQRGDKDTKDALLHSSDAMLAKHYDRSKSKKATPAG